MDLVDTVDFDGSSFAKASAFAETTEDKTEDRGERSVGVMRSICGFLTKAATLQHSVGFFGFVWRRWQTAATGTILTLLFFMARL